MSDKPQKSLPPLPDGALAYHRHSRHRLDGYAPGPQALDWEEQPDPFRRFKGCRRLELALAADATVDFGSVRSGTVKPQGMNMASLGALLELALGISAWKQLGPDRWAVRCNPSSGNLHPVEAYLLSPGHTGHAEMDTGLDAGLYHYQAEDHSLARRCVYSAGFISELKASLPAEAMLLGLSLVSWREAWKYGDRAWRYCLLDLGHALGALRYAAACHGWSVQVLDHLADDTVSALLGLDRHQDFHADEAEAPGLLAVLHPTGTPAPAWQAPEDVLEKLANQAWYGKANRLDLYHREPWPVVGSAAEQMRKPATDPAAAPSEAWPELPPDWPEGPDSPVGQALDAAALIRRRRSARAFNGKAGLPQAAFFRLLDRCLPRPGRPPWSDRHSQVHMILFVHQVEGLASGLYALPRNAAAIAGLQQALRAEFAWERIDAAPPSLPLYRLISANARSAASRLACHQLIAGGSAFSVVMLGEMQASLADGDWGYRTLLTEAGLLGQALYLEAEAEGIGGTGIGCFFDEATHEVLGITDSRYQAVYQFAVGTPRDDGRIETGPAYPQRLPAIEASTTSESTAP